MKRSYPAHLFLNNLIAYSKTLVSKVLKSLGWQIQRSKLGSEEKFINKSQEGLFFQISKTKPKELKLQHFIAETSNSQNDYSN
jgi:hypothetical protein